jgi:hypothetical protein
MLARLCSGAWFWTVLISKVTLLLAHGKLPILTGTLEEYSGRIKRQNRGVLPSFSVSIGGRYKCRKGNDSV